MFTNPAQSFVNICLINKQMSPILKETLFATETITENNNKSEYRVVKVSTKDPPTKLPHPKLQEHCRKGVKRM